jgi:hypothetical protein
VISIEEDLSYILPLTMVLFSSIWNIFVSLWAILFGDSGDEPQTTPTTAPIKLPVPFAPTSLAPVPVRVPTRIAPVSVPSPSTPKAPTKTVPSSPTAKAPMYLKPTKRPSNAPTKPKTQAPVLAPILNGQWIEVNPNATISKRHEACFVTVKGLAYLIGGRGMKNIDVYNPNTGRWVQKTGPPIELHHMQCVPVPIDDQIYIVSSWTGGFPKERNNSYIYVCYLCGCIILIICSYV